MLLSTPFPGFKTLRPEPSENPAIIFQLPFRDSYNYDFDPLKFLLLSTPFPGFQRQLAFRLSLNSFNSLSGILRLQPGHSQDPDPNPFNSLSGIQTR